MAQYSKLILALALANRHPDPDGFTEAVERALSTGDAYPDEKDAREAAVRASEDAKVEAAAVAAPVEESGVPVIFTPNEGLKPLISRLKRPQ